jgi:hypothetical protein
VHVTREKMDETCFLGAGLARKNFGERRVASHEEIERGVDGVEIVELVQALGAGAEFAGRLRAAEKEHAEQGDFVAMEIVGVLEAMLELGDATVGGGGARKAVLIQRMEGLANGIFVEGCDGVAVRFLVAGVEESVEGERVVLRSGDLFFDEGAEDARFRGCQMDVHGDR